MIEDKGELVFFDESLDKANTITSMLAVLSLGEDTG